MTGKELIDVICRSLSAQGYLCHDAEIVWALRMIENLDTAYFIKLPNKNANLLAMLNKKEGKCRI